MHLTMAPLAEPAKPLNAVVSLPTAKSASAALVVRVSGPKRGVTKALLALALGALDTLKASSKPFARRVALRLAITALPACWRTTRLCPRRGRLSRLERPVAAQEMSLG